MSVDSTSHSASRTREIFRTLLLHNRVSTTSTSPSKSPPTPTSPPTSTPMPSPCLPPPLTVSLPLPLPTPQTTTTTAPHLLTSPPRKNTIRPIENDQNNRREKYDGSRWRSVCSADNNQCRNVVYIRDLCQKHHLIQRTSEPPKKKPKLLQHHFSMPMTTAGNQARHIRTNTIVNNQNTRINENHNNDDDIEIVQVISKSPAPRRTTCTSIKTEYSDFNIFSVDYVDDPPTSRPVKEEPPRSTQMNEDIQFLTSKTPTSNGVNITEMVAKKLPPLTDFEEDYLATRMIERLPVNCLMIDAQLFLHREAIQVVKKNYRLTMESIAPEYFYDFLLRHPRVAIHFQRWFSRCKPSPPTTGCQIDMKVWTLGMIVRGASAADPMIDECEG